MIKMCSVTEAEEELTRLQIKPTLKDCSSCMKCREKAVILVRARDPLCRNCFLNYFTHKFRATLGKAKVIRQGEKVLLAFSGGSASCCLLKLVEEGLSENAHKKLRFIPEVLYIDEGNVLGWTAEKCDEVTACVHKFTKSLGFKSTALKIDSIFADEDIASPIGQQTAETPLIDKNECWGSNSSFGNEKRKNSFTKIADVFANLKTLTAKQDLLSTLRNQLLLKYAKSNSFTKIIVAETSTSLSIKLLTNIALGKGGSLPVDIGVFDWRDSDVGTVRPMRELTLKEVAFYNRIHGIEPVSFDSLDTKEADNASLQRQTEAFVTNLQASFPATVSTIFRTGDKLTLRDDTTSESCAMCKAPMRTLEKPTSSENYYSSDTETTASDAPKEGCCGKGDGSCSSNKKRDIRLSKDDVIKKLCYGCQLTFKDMNWDTNLLPSFAVEELAKEKRRSQMRKSIQEFLL